MEAKFQNHKSWDFRENRRGRQRSLNSYEEVTEYSFLYLSICSTS